MGRDKAALPVGEVSLLEHLARRLSAAVDEVLVAGGAQRQRILGVRTVTDVYGGLGPLAGMHAGFLEARQPLVWVVACDLPEVEPQLGPLMLGYTTDVDAVVPRPYGEPEGVCAVYRRELAPRIEACLKTGQGSVKQLLTGLRVRYLEAEELRSVDPELRSFHNLNTPADYRAWISSR